MKTLCAWCQTVIIDGEENKLLENFPVSHGICPKCAQTLFKEISESLDSFLDGFSVPIIVIDENEKVLSANRKAIEISNLNKASLNEARTGDIIQCVHADEPGGCGKTIHCQSCVIRKSILHTQKTGNPVKRAQAIPDLNQFENDNKVVIHISTEKIGDVVFLKIEDSPNENGYK